MPMGFDPVAETRLGQIGLIVGPIHGPFNKLASPSQNFERESPDETQLKSLKVL